MLPYIHIILPSYFVMAFLGGFTILIFLYFRFEKFELTFEQFLKLFLLCATTCFFGSKFLSAFVMIASIEESFNLQDFFWIFVQSGYVFYGGLFGALFGVWIAPKIISGLNYDLLCQMIAPALPLFHGFGRIGCMLAGCCYGVTLNPSVEIFEGVHLTLFPTQLLESLYEFSLFAVLYFLEKNKKNLNLLACYLLSYSIFRFFIEFYRADEDRGFWFGFSTAQWISLAIAMYYITKKFFITRRKLLGA